jgi:hypothetical protein
LDAYVHYGKMERADLYGDILNDCSPQEEAWVQWWNTTTNWLNKNETFCNVSIDYIRNTISSVCEWKHKLIQVHFFPKGSFGHIVASGNMLGNLLPKPASEAIPTRDLNECALGDLHK